MGKTKTCVALKSRALTIISLSPSITTRLWRCSRRREAEGDAGDTEAELQLHNTILPRSGATKGEGYIARMIEEQNAKIPSDVFLWAAGRSIAASLALKL